MDINLNSSVNINIDYFQIIQEDDDIMLLEAYLVSEGFNLHNTNFSLDAINDAFPSLANKPVLCLWDNIFQDFKEHARKSSDFYKQIFVGTVPESNSGKIVDYNNKKWQMCNLIIWKKYNPHVAERLKRNNDINGKTNISIEVIPLEIEKLENGIDIKKYKYGGICLLGQDKTEAIPGAKVEILKFSNNEYINSDGYNEFTKQCNQMYFSIQKPKTTKIKNEVKYVEKIIKILSNKLEKGQILHAIEDNYAIVYSCNNLFKYSFSEKDGDYSIDFSSKEEIPKDEIKYCLDVYAKLDDTKNKLNDSKKELDKVEKDKKDIETKYSEIETKFSKVDISKYSTEIEKLNREVEILKEEKKERDKKDIENNAILMFAKYDNYIEPEEKKELDEIKFSISIEEFNSKINSIIVNKIEDSIEQPLKTKGMQFSFLPKEKKLQQTNTNPYLDRLGKISK